MALEYYLVIRHERALERLQHVEVAEATIGRSASNVVCLPDLAVSRNHALLLWTPTEFLIRDLGSHNGTLLNGQPIVDAVLPAPALLEFGPYQLMVFRDLDAAQSEVKGMLESTFKQPGLLQTAFEREQLVRKLTSKEFRIYEEFLSGRTEKEVAHLLKVSINTVHTHARAIYKKLKVTSRGELLSFSVGHLTQPG